VKEKLQAFQYGARFCGDTRPAWVYWMKEEDFRRELRLAFFETKDLDTALDRLKKKVVAEVRARA
jgi:hypothetical protein